MQLLPYSTFHRIAAARKIVPRSRVFALVIRYDVGTIAKGD